MLSILDPGIITAALIFGPSKMTITSKMGADFGFSLIWIIVVAIFFMSVYTNMSARIVPDAGCHESISQFQQKT